MNADPNQSMKCNLHSRRLAAFSAIDLLVVLGLLAALAALILPNLVGTGCRSERIACVSNLKQVGLAFRMWANDHEKQFPMAVPAEKNGAMELTASGQAMPAYQVLEKELSTPKVLHCPKDSKRKRATEFENLTAGNLSYLVGLDATVSNAQPILAADRNVTVNGVQLRPGLAVVSEPRQVGWSKTIHQEQGNLLFGDGSAAQTTTYLLQRQFESSAASGITTNRFAVP